MAARRPIQSIEEANLELIKSLLLAFSRADAITVREMLTEDVVFHFPGANALAGDYKGKDQALQLLLKVARWTHGSSRVQLHDVLANEQHGVLMYTVTARHEERQFKYRYIDVYHFRDGQVCEVWGYPGEDPEAFDRFYSD